ncbi:MAG: STAS domain-containing protein [Marinifilaceae bacterium]
MILNLNTDSSLWVAQFQPDVTRFTLAHTEDVKNELSDVIQTPQVKLIIDMENINFMDSSAIGCVLSIIKNAERQQGSVQLCNASPRIMELFHMLHLVHLANSNQTLEDAKSQLQ